MVLQDLTVQYSGGGEYCFFHGNIIFHDNKMLIVRDSIGGMRLPLELEAISYIIVLIWFKHSLDTVRMIIEFKQKKLVPCGLMHASTNDWLPYSND